MLSSSGVLLLESGMKVSLAVRLAVSFHNEAGGLAQRVGGGAGGMDISGPIPGEWATGDFRAGDALIFADTTVHCALPNRTAEIRQSFDARYQPAQQPIADTNMAPYSGCGSWEEVYADWSSDDGQYYWRALCPNVVPLDRSHYERRDRMAFDMAARGELAARDALLRIVQRDPDKAKRQQAEALLQQLAAAPHQHGEAAQDIEAGDAFGRGDRGGAPAQRPIRRSRVSSSSSTVPQSTAAPAAMMMEG